MLAGITVFSTAGDSLLARGMKDLGNVSLHNFSGLLLADPQSLGDRGNPVADDVFRVLHVRAFMGRPYLCAACHALQYVLVALIGRFSFHEEISPTRWLGIALITAGVGFVAAGPSLTPSRKTGHAHSHDVSHETVSPEVEP